MAHLMKKMTDINQIIGFGVMTTPGLVVDGQVLVAGKVPSPADLEKMLS